MTRRRRRPGVVLRLRVRIEEGHGRRRVLEALKLLHAHLEAGDVLAHELGAGLSLAIVVFAAFRLLCADALLTCGLRAVAALEEVSVAARVARGWTGGGERTDHLAFPTAETCFACRMEMA